MPGVAPKKGSDVACGSVQCYQVTIELTSDELKALASPDPSATPDASAPALSGTVSLVVTVEKDTLHLAGITATVDGGADGKLDIKLTLSKWDVAVPIAAPPADQVK